MSAAAEALEARAEVLKLARILERDPATLAYLQQLPLQDLRQLRDQVTEVLWTAHGHVLNRLAAASKLLPTGVTAAISERAFGPLLSARLAALLDPPRAVQVAGKLSTPFLAEIAVELDPRRANAVISKISPERIAEVTRELVARHEYVTMGRYVGQLSDDALTAALGVMDNSSLLQVAFVLEDEDRLERLIELLPDGRLAGLVQTASEDDLWLEAVDLLNHLTGPPREVIAAELTARLLALPRDQRQAIAELAREGGAVTQLGALGDALAGF
jgi:hypothetical protein